MNRSIRRTCLVAAAATVLGVYGAASAAVTFDWATIGNPHNAPDDTSYGSVDYTYKISKYEATNDQYVDFLNAVAKTDTYGLYNTSMGTIDVGGITRSGSSGNYHYALKTSDWGDRPVNFVSWYSAARFVNWLANGQPSGNETAGITETGTYTFTGATTVSGRNANATFVLPNEDEWYKAAFYDPNKAGGAGYWDYATGGDTAPSAARASDDTGNDANYVDTSGGPYNYTYPGPYRTSPVGAYTLSSSPYGTYDQDGNLEEWNETASGGNRIIRGGSWAYGATKLSVDHRGIFGPNNTVSDVGFRVAMVPEPTGVAIVALGAAALIRRRRRA